MRCVNLPNGLANDGEGVMADLSVRHQVVGKDQIPRIDLGAIDELVDLDGSRRFQRDVLEFLLGHLDVGQVAIGRVVLTNREHIIALDPLGKGLMGALLRYPYEVRSADEYFDDIQDVKVTKDMLDLARHIVNQKAGHFEPDKFEDQYETALIDLINQKRAGKPITAKARPRGENVVDLMDALRKSIGGAAAAATEAPKKPAKKARKAAAGQKEMLMPIGGKKPAKEAAAKKPAAKPQRKSA
jgi:DNA end-binding protein Ku